jgi:hypothetical protein
MPDASEVKEKEEQTNFEKKDKSCFVILPESKHK